MILFQVLAFARFYDIDSSLLGADARLIFPRLLSALMQECRVQQTCSHLEDNRLPAAER